MRLDTYASADLLPSLDPLGPQEGRYMMAIMSRLLALYSSCTTRAFVVALAVLVGIHSTTGMFVRLVIRAVPRSSRPVGVLDLLGLE